MNDVCLAVSTGIAACWLGEVPDVQSGARTDSCTWDARTLSVTRDFDTLGVLVLYTKGVVTDWVDVIITGMALTSLTESRMRELEAELGAPLAQLEVARRQFNGGHADVPGSSSFEVIRLSRTGTHIA